MKQLLESYLKRLNENKEAKPVIVEIVNKPETIWKCPHCEKEILEKHIGGTELGESFHSDCRNKIVLPLPDDYNVFVENFFKGDWNRALKDHKEFHPRDFTHSWSNNIKSFNKSNLTESIDMGFLQDHKEKLKHYKSYEIRIVVNDPDREFLKLVYACGSAANPGHSFDVVMDPDSREYKQSFFLDGDGSFHMNELSVSGKDEIEVKYVIPEKWLKILDKLPKSEDGNQKIKITFDDDTKLIKYKYLQNEVYVPYSYKDKKIKNIELAEDYE